MQASQTAGDSHLTRESSPAPLEAITFVDNGESETRVRHPSWNIPCLVADSLAPKGNRSMDSCAQFSSAALVIPEDPYAPELRTLEGSSRVGGVVFRVLADPIPKG